MPDEILLGDLIKSRKPHPCGSDEWTVIRTGADIKMKCNGKCHHHCQYSCCSYSDTTLFQHLFPSFLTDL